MAKEFQIPPRLVGQYFTARDVAEILAYEIAESEIRAERAREGELKQAASAARERVRGKGR